MTRRDPNRLKRVGSLPGDNGVIADVWYRKDEKGIADRIVKVIERASADPECTAAFEDVGATPIGRQFVVVTTERVFSAIEADGKWSLGTDYPKKMRKQLEETPETLDISYGDRNVGVGFIGITNSAISENDEALAVVVIHSLVHTG